MKETTIEKLTLNVDYRLTFKQMFAACNFSSSEPIVRERNFPIPVDLNRRFETLTVKLFHFNRSVHAEDAVFTMEKNGYRPAKIAELFAFSKTYPDLQKKFPIIALGSITEDRNGNHCSPFISGSRKTNQIGVFWNGSGCYPFCRFLAVKKDV